MSEALSLARRVVLLDTNVAITAAANPIAWIQELLGQRRLLAQEVLRLHAALPDAPEEE